MSNTPITTERQRALRVQARSQAAIEAAPRRDLSDLLKAANGVAVSVHPGYYLVTFSPHVKPQNHVVTKDRQCTCTQGADCPAVHEVAKYLRAGGARAPAAPIPAIPTACPVCGGAVHFSPALTSKTVGLGWTCDESAKEETPGAPTYVRGQRHFIQWSWMGLKSWATQHTEAAHAIGAVS